MTSITAPTVLYLIRLPVCRDFDLPGLVCRDNMFFHRFDGLRLAMDQKRAERRPFEPAQPAKDFAVIPMGRETIDDVNCGTNWILLGENRNLLRALGKRSAARAGRLKPDEH